MTVFEWQSLLYPILLASSLLAAGMNIGVYWLRNRSPNILASAAIWMTHATTMAVLTMVTGKNPVLDIDQFRPLIVQTRVVLTLALLVYNYFLFKRLIND